MPRKPPSKDSALFKLGDQIKIRRMAAGMTQRQLANVVGASFSAVMKWEQGLVDPGLDNYLRVCRAVNVSLLKFISALNLDGHDPGPYPARPTRKFDGVRAEKRVRNRSKHGDDDTVH